MLVGFEPTTCVRLLHLLGLQTFGRVLPSAVPANTPSNLSVFIAVPTEQSQTWWKR